MVQTSPCLDPGPLHHSMRFADSLPPELEGLVEKAWLLSRDVCDAEGRFEVFPDANFGVGIHLTDSRCAVVAGGPVTGRFHARLGDAKIYWLRFRPGKMPRIADISPRDLVNVPGIILDRLLGVDIDELGERLKAAACEQARLKILGSVFSGMGSLALCQDRRCRMILEMLDATGGQVSVNSLSGELGLSTRTIRRVLLDQVGLTPKQLILNVRLQRTITRLKTRPDPLRLAELASECGFADQSHMIKDFKKHTGRLPSAF